MRIEMLPVKWGQVQLPPQPSGQKAKLMSEYTFVVRSSESTTDHVYEFASERHVAVSLVGQTNAGIYIKTSINPKITNQNNKGNTAMYFRQIALVAFLALVSACSSMTTISSPHAGTTLALKDRAVSLPLTEKMKGTSFGNYEFKAVDDGAEPFYGILPLRFKGGHLAVDIILFAPAAFFNLREVFPYYEIDVGQRVIRYKSTPTEGWTEYKPKAEEAAHARTFFEAKPVAAAH